MPPIYAPPGAPTGGGPGGSWSPTEALAFGWNAIMGNFQGIALPLAALMFVVSLLSGIPSGGLSYVLTRTAMEIVEPAFLPFIQLGIRFVTQILGAVVGAYFLGGASDFALRVARGQTPEFNVVFGGGKYFGPMLIATLVANFAVTFGFIFCIAPGLILAAGLATYQSLIVDQRLGGVDALKKSWELTDGHKGQLVVFLLLAGLVAIAGAAACCLPLLLVSAPMITIAGAYIYLKLIGEQPRLPTKL